MTLLASLILCICSGHTPTTELQSYMADNGLHGRVTDCGHRAVLSEPFVGSAFGGRVPFGERGKLVLSDIRGHVVWTFVSSRRSVRVGEDDVEEDR